MATVKPKNILIAPLDWGLGHTTRCIPLIRHIQQLGHNPIVAGNASQRAFIQQTMGASVATVHLDGYNVTYSKWNKAAQAGLLAQLPRIAATIAREHNWLQQQAAALQLHGVIADNRYGLYHARLPSAIITHQLQVLTGMGPLADRAAQLLHYRLLRRYTAIWVADAADIASNLGGRLSHPARLPGQSEYLGLLSRFSPAQARQEPEARGTLMILLSGPEPQRSNLARILWGQALAHKGAVIFIEGNDTVVAPSYIPPHITYRKRLTDAGLAPLLMAADMVICRSGYSTIMDLAALQKKAILIPTPGQTEQLYLARHLHAQGMYYSAGQDGFDMQQALAEAAIFPYHPTGLAAQYSSYKPVLDTWLQQL